MVGGSIRRDPLGRRPVSEIDILLSSWGHWLWMSGYSVSKGCYSNASVTTRCIAKPKPLNRLLVVRPLTARATATRNAGGPRVLAGFGAVMPAHLQAVHWAVHQLPDGQILAVCEKYASGRDAEGKMVEDEVKAFRMGISIQAFHDRLRRARIRLAEKLATPTRKSVDSGHSRKSAPMSVG